jgi:hypothetical protein
MIFISLSGWFVRAEGRTIKIIEIYPLTASNFKEAAPHDRGSKISGLPGDGNPIILTAEELSQTNSTRQTSACSQNQDNWFLIKQTLSGKTKQIISRNLKAGRQASIRDAAQYFITRFFFCSPKEKQKA